MGHQGIKIMGILNVTPDSFYDGGKFIDPKNAKKQIDFMLEQGADIIDIGGFSSRPGSTIPSIEEELSRIIPVLDILQHYNIDISVDTCRSEIVREVIVYGNVKYINDISGGKDEQIFDIIKNTDTTYILMHSQGDPLDMQIDPKYNGVVIDVYDFLKQKIDFINKKGVNNIIVDPGFGFGKTISHNYQLLNNLDKFKKLGYPILVGLSRKSMIYKLLSLGVQECLGETMALNLIALEKGANILRVHDVGKHINVIKMYREMKI